MFFKLLSDIKMLSLLNPFKNNATCLILQTNILLFYSLGLEQANGIFSYFCSPHVYLNPASKLEVFKLNDILFQGLPSLRVRVSIP